MAFINLTPHSINLNSGATIPPSGDVARVSCEFGRFDDNGVCTVHYGQIANLPMAQPDTLYIVSAMVLSAIGGLRQDVVAPATGHPDTVRINGRIVSVPGFVK